MDRRRSKGADADDLETLKGAAAPQPREEAGETSGRTHREVRRAAEGEDRARRGPTDKEARR
ncbi:MAG TPA: hypothetical protein VM889_12875 [Candidatus Thermoplasmatota archaeon]|nr:hypothetical protein [Candidatus Thermoplasmatota archaeon]